MYITIDLMVDISKHCFNLKMIEFIMHKIFYEFLFKSFIIIRKVKPEVYTGSVSFKDNWFHLFILNY